MSINVKFNDNSVCFAGWQQWYSDGAHLRSSPMETASLAWALSRKDFQLNTIKQGDYISKSDLDTEDEYNRAVEVFGLFGFKLDMETAWGYASISEFISLACCSDGLWQVASDQWSKRKLTFKQLDAIGELKLLMNERDKQSDTLTSEEETELKSRAMVSELERQDDEWPKVGDDAIIESPHHCAGLSRIEYLSDKFVIFKRGNDEHSELTKNCTFKKPKSKEDLLIEELQTKLIENNAVDNWMLASDILNGKIKGLTYKDDL